MRSSVFQRNTKQRAIILRELKNTKSHPSAESLFLTVKKCLPSISFATVYRNLNLLAQAGEILELRGEKYLSRYDGDTSDHAHFFCISCQEVFDIFGPTGKDLDKEVEEKLGCKVAYRRINFYGHCANCQSVRHKTENT
ncbi:MAG TPA: transcriptional repressor [Candidatus Omnitrophota bacterium]|nr:transcriptional repressor [Candidatus Omnitrophota bacterium]HPD84550.1 transcriptional repressor [Candidatus Omnitrophota bacterium]HRZ03408.1 transcriptional repressor [Candidatus Omnitrophota bacterium]